MVILLTGEENHHKEAKGDSPTRGRLGKKQMINSGIEPLTLRYTIHADIRRMLYRLS